MHDFCINVSVTTVASGLMHQYQLSEFHHYTKTIASHHDSKVYGLILTIAIGGSISMLG